VNTGSIPWLRALAVTALLGALAIAALLAVPAWSSYAREMRGLASDRALLARLNSTPAPSEATQVPAVPDSADEETEFLGAMAEAAQLAGCRWLGLESLPANREVAGVTRRRTRLRLAGTYAAVRGFLAQLAQAPRFYRVTDISLTAGDAAAPSAVPGQSAAAQPLNAAVTVERFTLGAAPAESATTGR
jgi:hypothetical protein